MYKGRDDCVYDFYIRSRSVCAFIMHGPIVLNLLEQDGGNVIYLLSIYLGRCMHYFDTRL